MRFFTDMFNRCLVLFRGVGLVGSYFRISRGPCTIDLYLHPERRPGGDLGAKTKFRNHVNIYMLCLSSCLSNFQRLLAVWGPMFGFLLVLLFKTYPISSQKTLWGRLLDKKTCENSQIPQTMLKSKPFLKVFRRFRIVFEFTPLKIPASLYMLIHRAGTL